MIAWAIRIKSFPFCALDKRLNFSFFFNLVLLNEFDSISDGSSQILTITSWGTYGINKLLSVNVVSETDSHWVSDLFDCPLIIARFAVFVKGVTVVIVISIPDGYAYRWLCNELMKVRHPQDFYWFIMIFMSKDFSPFMKDCSGITSMFLSFLIEKFMKPFVNLRECNIHLVV